MTATLEFIPGPAGLAAGATRLVQARHGSRTPWASLGGALLLLLDIVLLVTSAALATSLFPQAAHGLQALAGVGSEVAQATFFAAVLAPFFLHDSRFGPFTGHRLRWEPVRSHGWRFLAFAAVVLMVGGLADVVDRIQFRWLATWLLLAWLLTTAAHALFHRQMDRLKQRGRLSEVVAVVGSGAEARRVLQSLRNAPAGAVQLAGVYDDVLQGHPSGAMAAEGTLDELIEMGRHRRIDWILLAMPSDAAEPLQRMLTRLMALSAPIALCLPRAAMADGDAVPMQAALAAQQPLLPRWCMTLLSLPVTLLHALAARARPQSRGAAAAAPLQLAFDDHDLEGFTAIAAGFGQRRFGYVVTPNADHVIRLNDDGAFRQLYASADYVLLDSRFLSHLMRLTHGIRLPVCTGSDLTARLFEQVIAPNDALLLIGGSLRQADLLRQRHNLSNLVHFNPPMGFVHDPVEVERCLQFIESHSPFRFCLLALGSPQQERVAQLLKARDKARGLSLCIGAAINFMTGDERRSPRWLQRCGLEWAFRLMQDPARMARRYLVRGPRVFGLLGHTEVVLRGDPSPPELRARAAA